MSKRRFREGQYGAKFEAPKVPEAKAPKVPTKLKRVLGEERQTREIQARTTPPRRKLTSEEASSRRPAYSPAYFREMEKKGLSVYSTPDGVSQGWFDKLTTQSQRAVSRTPIYGGSGETPLHAAIPGAISDIAGYGGYRMPAAWTPGGSIYINPKYAGEESLLQHELTHILKNPYPWEGKSELLNAMTPEQREATKDWYFRGEKPGLLKGTRYDVMESAEIIPTLLEMADWNPANLPENLKPFFMEMGMFQPSAFQLAEPAYGRTETGAVALPPRID